MGRSSSSNKMVEEALKWKQDDFIIMYRVRMGRSSSSNKMVEEALKWKQDDDIFMYCIFAF